MKFLGQQPKTKIECVNIDLMAQGNLNSKQKSNMVRVQRTWVLLNSELMI